MPNSTPEVEHWIGVYTELVLAAQDALKRSTGKPGLQASEVARLQSFLDHVSDSLALWRMRRAALLLNSDQ
jgi:hypothetical protein